MYLEQLEYLIEVSKTKSITAASKNLHVAQQGVSKALHNLEIELGTTLFDRTKKGIVFTEAGEKTVLNAKDVLEHVEKLKNDALPVKRHARRNLSGTLNICFSPCLFTGLMPKIIASFKHDHPKVVINYMEGSRSDVFQAVQSKQYDIGFVAMEYRKDSTYPVPDDLLFHVLKKDAPYIVVNKNSPLAKNKTVSLSKLSQYPIAIYKPEYTQEQPLYKVLLSQQNVYNLCFYDDLLASAQDILQGNCIGLSSKLAYAHTLLLNKEQLSAIPIRDGVQTAVGYCVTRDKEITILIELLIKQFDNLCNGQNG